MIQLPDPGDIGHLELQPHLDENPFLRRERLDLPVNDPEDPHRQGAPLLLLQPLVGPQLPVGHGLDRLLADEAADEPGGELGLDLLELRLGHLHPLPPELVAGLAEGESVPDDQPLQPLRDRTEPSRLRRPAPFGPDVVLVVEEQVVDDGREVGPHLAAPLEQAEYGVILLDELHDDLPAEVLRLLRAEA